MKTFVLIIITLYSNLSFADGYYERYEVDMQNTLKTVREQSDYKFNLSEIKAELKDIKHYLIQKGTPLLKNIYAKATELDHNLQGESNLPNLVQLISLCATNSIDRMEQLEDEFIRKNNLVTYASILNCNSILNFTSKELHHFIYDNEDFIKDHQFFNDTRHFYFLTKGVSDLINHESLFFLTYLQQDANAYPEAVQ